MIHDIPVICTIIVQSVGLLGLISYRLIKDK